jgi:hypothetical protein
MVIAAEKNDIPTFGSTEKVIVTFTNGDKAVTYPDVLISAQDGYSWIWECLLQAIVASHDVAPEPYRIMITVYDNEWRVLWVEIPVDFYAMPGTPSPERQCTAVIHPSMLPT